MAMEPFIGEIILFGGNFAPKGWAFCNGQILPISQNTALFSIIGTMYGGDGSTTFGLPDLRGRAPIHAGNGPGLSPVHIGEKGGIENVTLTVSHMPAHTHGLNVSNTEGTTSTPVGNYPAVSQYQADRSSPVVPVNSYGNSPNEKMAPSTVDVQGGNMAFNIRNPYLAVNYIIALNGVYPTRD
ncbi:MAG: tail fiber protein [Gillisia sp.]